MNKFSVHVCTAMMLGTAIGCHSAGSTSGGRTRLGRQREIRRVACLYDRKPWLNLDKGGDRDPEGVRYRLFLDPGTGRGILADGSFHVEMYRLDHSSTGETTRTLVSEWQYPTDEVNTIKSKYLGLGYHLFLRWASKSIAGHEIELITRFQDTAGRVVRAGTKRLRVPKYTS